MKRLLCGMLLCCGLALAPVYAEDKAPADTEKPVVIKGIVYDEFTNKPIPNLDIYPGPVDKKITVTDQEGVFQYPVKPGETFIHILPFSDDIVGRSVFVNVKEFEGKVVKIIAEHGMKLKVKVLDDKGKPIKDALTIYKPGGGASGGTDEYGVAVIGMVSRIRDGQLTVSAPGYKTWVRENMYAPLYDADGITVTLAPEDPKEEQPTK